MIEVVRSRLDARQRHRWHVALERTPILSVRAPRVRGPWLVAVGSAGLYVAMLAVILAEGAWGIGDGVLGALAAGGTMLAMRTGLWAWREAKSAWPSGRFLFSWGYVEVEHDRLRYVAGTDIEHEVVAIVGTEQVEVRLASAGWSTSFLARADTLPRDALARLGTPQPAPVLDGYRDAPWIIEGPRVAPARLSPRVRAIGAVAVAAVLGAALSPFVGAASKVASSGPRRASHAHAAPTSATRVPFRPRNPAH